MSKLTPDDIVELVSKAFVLEAITDKPGCTTRYEDLPGKPLEDFIMAGLNSAKHFGRLADDEINYSKQSIFSHAVEAIKESNKHKSDKYINVGLLEIMTLIVAARMQTDDIDDVLDTAMRILKETTNDDVAQIIALRKVAWSTSRDSSKNSDDFIEYESLNSLIEYYETRCKNHSPDTSFYQWSKQSLDGYPMLRQFVEAYAESGEIILTTNKVFMDMIAENPDVKLGIVADMCAAAIFIWLSFNDSPINGS